MKIKVSVPATSANVGSGFDALGLAVTLYNTVTFEESDKLDISAADGTRIPRNESNLVYRSAKGLFDKVGKKIPPLKIVQTNPIPMARGLGSSSACIIAGLLGANRMLGDVLNTQELLTLATAIEGHPDNVAPALLGGLTSSVFEDGVVYSVKRDVDQSLCFAAIVPDYKLLTEAARAALPKQVAHKDAVYNLSRAALVPAAFCEGRHDLLGIATEDKLHQPYRMPLMPGSREVFGLCGVDRGVPEVWGSVYDVRELLDSTVKLMDGKSPLEMKLPMPFEMMKKPLLKKIDRTIVGKLLDRKSVV